MYCSACLGKGGYWVATWDGPLLGFGKKWKVCRYCKGGSREQNILPKI
jgi:hypothetical protein